MLGSFLLSAGALARLLIIWKSDATAATTSMSGKDIRISVRFAADFRIYLLGD
jgi:hypothetical protein